jgi:uncharacterized membrane protein YccC
MAEQLVEIVGALLVLSAYALAQFAGLPRRSFRYLLANLVGAAILAALAAIHHQWGFLLLQGVWAVVALWGVVGRLREREAS